MKNLFKQSFNALLLYVVWHVHSQRNPISIAHLRVVEKKGGQATNLPYASKLSLCLLAFSCSLLSAVSLAGTVSQEPLFLTTNVKPNIMLMVDNSGSMSTLVKVDPTTYDPSTTYLASANCSVNAMPFETVTTKTVLVTTTTTTTITLNTKKLCEANGEKWNSKKGTCSKATKTVTTTTTTPTTVTTRTPITYDTTIPIDFIGNVTRSGRSRIVGKLCFTASSSYTVSAGVGIPSTVTGDAQRANYLNWYYKEKLNALQGGDSRLNIAKAAAVGLVNSLNDNVRIGLTTFNNTQGGLLLEAIDDISATKKTNVISRINSLTASSWTPLAETTATIGKYFATGYSSNITLHPDTTAKSDQDVDDVLLNNLVDGTTWRTIGAAEPKFSTPPIQYSCQKSFNVLVTDGLPTQDQDISKYLADYDGDCTGSNSSQCLSVSPNYDLKKEFFSSVPGDNTSDYLDDVADALKDIDLRPDLTKKLDSSGVPTTKNNLITYSIGFADADINPTLTEDLNDNGILDSGEDVNGNGKLDRVNPILKDAATQGGGHFFFANNAAELSASLQNAFDSIVRQDASSSAVAANSTQFQTDAQLFQALFNSGDWSGNIKAFPILTEDLNKDGVLQTSEDTNGNGKIDAGAIGAQVWDAASKIPKASSRRIFSYNPVTSEGIEFLWPNLNDAQKLVLDKISIADSTSPVLDYLRGDKGNEGTESGDYRIRESLLGDIINSDPLFVGGQDLGYTSLPDDEGSSYPAHVDKKKGNTEMLYVGSNDGMLHGFHVSVGSDEGTEGFAYVPNSLISAELAGLTDQNYVHRYFMDGAPQFGDAYYDAEWHTVLLGSMGAGNTTAVANASDGGKLATGTGGRAIFALDISDPENFNEKNVLWEFSNRQDADLGYTIPPPRVARMADGSWAAIVANGYSSTSGKAILFILNIKTGAVIRKIEADVSGSNGLSGPTPVDVDNDKIIDYIYAGDLKGNLWKFDVSSTNSSDWKVAYSGLPLFVAMDDLSVRQPITVIPTVAKATGTDQTSGVMLYFGTGKYFEVGDHQVATGPQIQSFYGIWDVCDKTSSASCSGLVSGRSVLQKQTITDELSITTSSSTNLGVRRTTQCEVLYGTTTTTTTAASCTSTINRRGWYLDLLQPPNPPGTAQGERVVSPALVRNNAVIFVTLIPINSTCEPSGTGWLMELDLNGARFVGSPIDINDDGKIDSADLVKFSDGTTSAASGVGSTVGIMKTPAVVQTEDCLENKYISGTSSAIMNVKENSSCQQTPTTPNPAASSAGRRSWRQLR